MHASRIFFSILALALHVNAHGVLTTVTGTNGVTGQGFGVIDSTPRDGTRRNPFQVCIFQMLYALSSYSWSSKIQVSSEIRKSRTEMRVYVDAPSLEVTMMSKHSSMVG